MIRHVALNVSTLRLALTKRIDCDGLSWDTLRRAMMRTMKHRILLLSILAGMGHIRAAQAIEEALKELSEEIETLCLDPMRFVSPQISDFINRFYLWFIEPPLYHFWGFLYENRLLSAPYSPFRWIISQAYAHSIQEILREFDPEVIVSTHPFATAGASLLKKRGVVNIPLVSVATDFDVHPFSINHEVDVFIVPDIPVSEDLQKKRISREKVGVEGIPIDPKFNKNRPKEELKKKLGLNDGLSTILILSGGFGVGPIEEVVLSFKEARRSLQLIVVAGKDETLREELERIKGELGIKVRIFGYIENMDEIMEVSDLVITKPGGLSVAEALAKRLPLILLDPIKGQEVKNFKHLIKMGVGIHAKKIEETPKIVTHLLNNPARLDLMKSRIEELSRPNSAIEIARLLLDLVKEKEPLLKED